MSYQSWTIKVEVHPNCFLLDRPSKLGHCFNGELPSNNTTQNQPTPTKRLMQTGWSQTNFPVYLWYHHHAMNVCACMSPTQKEMYVFILLVMYIMIKCCGNDKSLQTKATQQSTWYTWHMWQSGRYTYLVIIPNKIFQLMYFWSKIRGCWRLYIIPWFSYKPSNILHCFHNNKMIC